MTGSSMWRTDELYLNEEKLTGVHQPANFDKYAEILLSHSTATTNRLQLSGFKLDISGVLGSTLNATLTSTQAGTTVDDEINTSLRWLKQQLTAGKT